MTGSHHGTTAGDMDTAGVPAFQAGQVYVDVGRRALEFLNEEAARLHRAGLPFTAADPMIPNLLTTNGVPVRAADLPLAVCWSTAKPVTAQFLWAAEDGTTRHVFWSAAPLPRSGPLTGLVGSVTCVPREPARQQLAPEPDWQQLAGLAHDLSAPLHSLSLIAEVLESAAANQPDLRKRLEAMQRTAARAQEIGSELLRQCRGPAPRARRHDWLDCDSFLAGLVDEHITPAGKKGLTIAADLAAVRGWQILIDRTALGRLLSNLLVNAVRYTPTGQVQLSVSWRGEPGQSPLALSVADTGQGIAPEESDSIFQPFTRGKAGADSNVEGSGLGLAVVERLAADLDLQLEVQTAVDVGSTFTVLIPARAMRAKEA